MKKLIYLALPLLIALFGTAAHAEEYTGSYEGWYYANQGQTGLTLTINEDNTGVFEFYNMPGRSNAASGSYTVTVSEENGVLTVEGDEWIEKPSTYQFVSLEGTVDGGVYSGVVSGNSSWEFVLNKNNDSYQQIADSVFEDHRYELITDGLNWEDARAECEEMGGHLVTINSEAEQRFIEQLLADSELNDSADVWIGTAEELGDYSSWVTGEAVIYTNWGVPQPDNLGGGQHHAVIVNGDRGSEGGSYYIRKYQWDDNTNSRRPYICEWETWSDSAEWSTPELQEAAENGLIPDVLVGKDMTAPITRGEFAAVSVKLFEAMTGGRAVMASDCPFTDIAEDESRNYILKAYNIGAVNGMSETTYEPSALLQREQLATMLTRVYKRSEWPDWTLETDDEYTINYSGVKKFDDDALISDYAKPSVYFMVKYNVLSGIGNNLFAPRNTTPAEEAEGYANATREQAVVMSLRSFENLEIE